jgi:hypothetical protein
MLDGAYAGSQDMHMAIAAFVHFLARTTLGKNRDAGVARRSPVISSADALIRWVGTEQR